MSDKNLNQDITENNILFTQGSQDITENALDCFRNKIRELCNVKNLHFLFGAGTSAGAIPTMVQIKKDLEADIQQNHTEFLGIYQSIQKENLEEVLSILHAKRIYLKGILDNANAELSQVEDLIKHIQNFMFKKINVNQTDESVQKAVDLYKKLYSKLALRNKDLSRLNIFTTNNDLLNEVALDSLNINYNNGFGGGLERRFNPARFRYTFSKKIDLNLEKFEPVENMVYLHKLHGSVNWVESEGNSLFKTEELSFRGGEESPDKPVLIYPTPLKQNLSLGSPYADLIREFQAKLSLPNSVLFVIGYSFSDEHLNNIIYQALASNSSISLVIFGNHFNCPLSKIRDNRIYTFSGISEGEKVHYFDYIVNKILPNLDENKDKKVLDDFIACFTRMNDSDKESD